MKKISAHFHPITISLYPPTSNLRREHRLALLPLLNIIERLMGLIFFALLRVIKNYNKRGLKKHFPRLVYKGGTFSTRRDFWYVIRIDQVGKKLERIDNAVINK